MAFSTQIIPDYHTLWVAAQAELGRSHEFAPRRFKKAFSSLHPPCWDPSISSSEIPGLCHLGGCGTSRWCWYRATDDLAVLLHKGEKSQAHEQDPHRVPNLEPHARLESRDDLIIEAGGIEGQGQLFREVTHLQFHFGADFLGEERGLVKT